ncbi:MAG: transcriptional repressor [Thermodesulfobacteriota bacterium]|nr:transcriptional repressor [Thermodesulfobacteriota bacterium]
MCDPQVRLETMIKKLKDLNFRITPQRLAVLKILAKSEGHPSVENIYKQVKPDFPTTSLATIYKTVNLLKQIGEVVELDFSEESNRYDGNKPYPHPHLICTRCKTIVDPDVAAVTELSKELANKTGYEIVKHRLDFFGICPRCQRNA